MNTPPSRRVVITVFLVLLIWGRTSSNSKDVMTPVSGTVGYFRVDVHPSPGSGKRSKVERGCKRETRDDDTRVSVVVEQRV